MKIKFVRILSVLFIVPWYIDAQPNAEVGDIWINPKDEMKFVWIPPGSLCIDVPIDTSDANKTKRVTITFESGFWMGQTEVTRKQFGKFVDETGYITAAEKRNEKFTWRKPGFKQASDHPVVYLATEDFQAYSDWAGVSLPYELEWLHAFCGGSETTFYWGDTLDERYVWYRKNSVTGTKPVGTKLPNSYGLYDMVGNVFEITRVCEDYWVLRGGSWTRCQEARAWWGPVYGNVLDGSVKLTLSTCMPSIFRPVNPDDDRGFRCSKRIDPYNKIQEQIGYLAGETSVR